MPVEWQQNLASTPTATARMTVAIPGRQQRSIKLVLVVVSLSIVGERIGNDVIWRDLLKSRFQFEWTCANGSYSLRLLWNSNQ